MTGTEWDETNILDILGDTLCRRVLVLCSRDKVSAGRLADRLDVSPPTVYRRIDSLVDYGLVREHRRMDEEGNHYRTFETALDRVEVAVTSRGYEVDVHPRHDIGGRFEEFWSEFRTGGYSGDDGRSTGTGSGSDPSPS